MCFLCILLSCTTFCDNTRRILFTSAPSDDDEHQTHHPKKAGCEHFPSKSGVVLHWKAVEDGCRESTLTSSSSVRQIWPVQTCPLCLPVENQATPVTIGRRAIKKCCWYNDEPSVSSTALIWGYPIIRNRRVKISSNTGAYQNNGPAGRAYGQ